MKKAFGEKRLENKIVYFKRKFNTLALPGCFFYIQRVRLKEQKRTARRVSGTEFRRREERPSKFSKKKLCGEFNLKEFQLENLLIWIPIHVFFYKQSEF